MLFLYKNIEKEQIKIEQDLSSLVAMDHERTIATFFVAENQIGMEVYHEKI